WRHDADFKRWEFQIRPGVKFHDGTPLTAEAVAGALGSAGEGATAQGDKIIISSPQPLPKLLYTLANWPIYKGGGGLSGMPIDPAMVGTGPFRLVARNGVARYGFVANEDYWAGRPYLDG